MNIFVCGNGTLKMGDFGTARHQLAGRPMTIDAFNPAFVTKGFIEEQHRYWMAVDDVFQMGQLLAMLLLGNVSTTVSLTTVSKLDCESALKEIIRRAIGPRSKRFANAFEMRQALEGKNCLVTASQLQSLRGKTVAFSGQLSLRRFDAENRVISEGGVIAKAMTHRVDVLVQGERSMVHHNGKKLRMLQQAEQLLKKGYPIQIINEAEFRRLLHRDLKRVQLH
jgi:NAD-dependent DNA ligase